jgi:hypothetical protein
MGAHTPWQQVGDSNVTATYIGTSIGQRLFSVTLDTVLATGSDNGNQYNAVSWTGVAALKCLSGEAMQCAFKPQSDSYVTRRQDTV